MHLMIHLNCCHLNDSNSKNLKKLPESPTTGLENRKKFLAKSIFLSGELTENHLYLKFLSNKFINLTKYFFFVL